MPQIEFAIGFASGLITGLAFWGIYTRYRRSKIKKLKKEHDDWWAWKEPYVQ